MMPASPVQPDRDERIAELEASLRRSSAVGVRIPVSLMGMVASVVLLGFERKDLAYFFSSRTPINLGAEGDYRLEALHSNRYAQIHGTPTLRGAYWREKSKTAVLVGVQGTPILVRRPAFATEDWVPGRTPPQPNQSPFGVRGRLLVAEDAARYRDGFEKIASMGEVRPRDGRWWILLEGERPGSDWSIALISTALALFFLANAWLFWRALQERLQRSAG